VQVQVDDHIGHRKVRIHGIRKGNCPNPGFAIDIERVRRTTILPVMPPNLPTTNVFRAGKAQPLGPTVHVPQPNGCHHQIDARLPQNPLPIDCPTVHQHLHESGEIHGGGMRRTGGVIRGRDLVGECGTTRLTMCPMHLGGHVIVATIDLADASVTNSIRSAPTSSEPVTRTPHTERREDLNRPGFPGDSNMREDGVYGNSEAVFNGSAGAGCTACA